MNLPNAFTAGRIAVTPLIAWLPLAPSAALRLTAFALFIVAAVSDYVDGHLARSRKQETDLGRLLDPLADKLLLLGTFIPMFVLMRPSLHSDEPFVARVLANVFPFHTPLGDVPLTWWVLAIVLGREAFMTLFRQAAARRGVVIAAIGPAKWKTTFQWIWVGAAYFWFFAATLATRRQWTAHTAWQAFTNFNGLVGVLAMIGAVGLTLYSLALYLQRYGRVFTGAPVRGRMTRAALRPLTPPAMHIEVVTIGDELLLGYTIDTNAAHLARTLAAEGVEIARRTTVGDSAPAIADAVRDALDRAGAVITTGGLGPTSDDLTKPSIAALFGRGMALDEEHLAWMEERFTRLFQRPMPAANRQQAMLPEGARKLTNHHGSAPGIWLEDDRGRWVAMLPGIPREMRGMLADTLLPLIRARLGAERRVVRSRTLRTTGVGESFIADRVATIAGGVGDAGLAYLPNAEGTDLRLTVRGEVPDEADRRLAASAERLRSVVADAIYGEDGADLAAVVLDLCRARGLSIAVAESCTGGLLGARLTAIPGSSDVVLGGVIAYANAVKAELLGVSNEDLRAHGAVSEPVVRAMATGVRAATGARLGMAITGVAGPGGGTEDKPVGTVWIATDLDGAVEARRTRLIGDRAEVRQRAAQAVLEMVRRRLVFGSSEIDPMASSARK